MRATFMNKLVFAEPGDVNTIKYLHQFRLDIQVYIKHVKAGERNWDVYLSAIDARSIPPEIRNGLIREFMLYVKNRARCGLDKLNYNDFIDMAKAVNLS
jgi:hypothetical protein